ncbi:MAG: proprotein convertase P-domain-containing protein [Pyrinomonadaceae bacterium]
MKKTSLLFLIGLVFSLACLLYFEPSKAQTKSSGEDSAPQQPVRLPGETRKLKGVPQTIRDAKAAGAQFDQRKLFQSSTKAITGDAQLSEVLSAGVVLNLNETAIKNILKENVGFLTLPLPDGKGGTIELELVKVDIFAPGFTVKTSDPTTEPLDESLGIHYRGIVKGNDHSLAAISIFNNEVMGFYSTEADGNSILGRLGGHNPTDKHILYAEKDLKVSSNFQCDTKDDGVTLPASVLQEPDEVAARCVRIYMEANYDLFLNKGSAANTTSYLTGMFNQSATLYSNEGLPVSISQIFVWTSPSPYTGTTSLEQLQQFQNFRTTFNGDLAHLLTLQSGFGGIAYRPGLCNTGSAYAFSAIDPTFNTVPTYSWTVEVFTHETGHNLGSPHTQSCAWNGDNTAIDGCAAPEGGNCPRPGLPPGGGTIMSYCHLTSVGINFTLGFGPQPRNVILNRFNTVTCLTDCGGGGGCTYSLSPASRNFTAAGGSGSVSVTTGNSCPWTATVNAPSLLEIVSRSQEENLMAQTSDPASRLGLTKAPETPQTVFLNSTPIIINDRTDDNAPPGTGSLYPSTINVSGMTGTITQVSVALNNLSHTYPDDVDVVLVGPGGQRAILMSDVGGGADVSGINLTFDQNGAALPDATLIPSGTFRPTNFNSDPALEPGGVDNFPSPGPGQSVYGSDLNLFNGSAPNGAWRLYVVDDIAVDSGTIATGWALGITTNGGGGGTSWINITSGSSGTGNGTVGYTVAANPGQAQRTGTITVNGQVHTVTQAGTGGGGCPSTLISPGQTINGSLTTLDCIFTGTTKYVDVYHFNGTAGQRIAVLMNSSAFDTYLYLVNSSNQTIAENDDGGGGTNSRIPAFSGFFTLPATGSYTILASSFYPDRTGAYSLSLVNETVCNFSISPTSQGFSSSGGNSSFNVATASGCAWSAVSNAGWITTSSSGSGNGTVNYTVAANSGTSQRTGTITVNGRTYTVTQSGASANVQVTVKTNPLGRSFTVDGTTYTSTRTFSWTSGTSHTIATSSPQNGSAGTRYVWSGWSDGGGISHNVAPTGSATYTANFSTQHFLTMNAGAGGIVSPGSGWYGVGTGVAISATPNAGFSFNSWTGSGSGSFTGANNPASVMMNGPISETAAFQTNATVYSISGTVKTGALGLSGVKLTLTGGAGFTPRTFTTTATGAYAFTALPAGRTYIVKPSKLGYGFTPASRTFTNLSMNQTPATASFPAVLKNYRSSVVKQILDLSTIDVPIVIADIDTITDLNVRIRLNHSYDADLDIYLVGPDGTIVELTTDNGLSGDNYGSGANSCASAPTIFDDAAPTLITAGLAPFATKFKPERPLSIFNGKSSRGTWKLRIIDDEDGDLGTLYCWELQFNRP